MKLVINAYLAALIPGVAEALTLSGRLGVDPAASVSTTWHAAVQAGHGREDIAAAVLALRH